MQRILIVEDDKAILNFMRVSLKARDYTCLEAQTGKEGLELFTLNRPDLVILDLGLPDMDGTEVLKEIRSFSQTPIIVVTARGQENEKADTLDMGADDYLCKPFSIVELLARIRVALRHSMTIGNIKQEPFIVIGDLKLDFEKRQVRLEGKEVHLTPNEYKII
jgi:two-component system, OmpR family, KDP operon response regulator KdpE